MKIGDKFPVALDGHVVAHAEVEDIDGREVILVIPPTRIKMGLAVSLTVPESDKDIVLDTTPNENITGARNGGNEETQHENPEIAAAYRNEQLSEQDKDGSVLDD